MAGVGHFKREKRLHGRFVKWLKEKIIDPVMQKLIPGVYNFLKRHGDSISKALEYVNSKLLSKDNKEIISVLTALIPGGSVLNSAINCVSDWIASGKTKKVIEVVTQLLEGVQPEKLFVSNDNVEENVEEKKIKKETEVPLEVKNEPNVIIPTVSSKTKSSSEKTEGENFFGKPI